ncbi:hypothetical protein MUK42_20655 [Musa troglodytarum]|uniref:Uncharacterized protein n=1 Tax=Musa troglodytarum TaxID=320322 RepID=A0A9E7HPS0_9LILI|nr:hypothetical protein MUK42_20655 [Musa troglodytarum]
MLRHHLIPHQIVFDVSSMSCHSNNIKPFDEQLKDGPCYITTVYIVCIRTISPVSSISVSTPAKQPAPKLFTPPRCALMSIDQQSRPVRLISSANEEEEVKEDEIWARARSVGPAAVETISKE